MAVTAEQAQQHQSAVDALVVIAAAQFLGYWRTLDLKDVPNVLELVPDFMITLGETFGPMAALEGADFYEELRLENNIRGSFSPDLADTSWLEGRALQLSNWALLPMKDPERVEVEIRKWAQENDRPLLDSGEIPASLTQEITRERLGNGLQKMVVQPSRDTIIQAADRDPANAKWARYASSTACTFCRLLATRDAVYATQQSASEATGRGAQKLGDKYHDNCKCVAVPEWDDAPYFAPDYVADWRQVYIDATREAATGSSDVREVLRIMRARMGSR